MPQLIPVAIQVGAMLAGYTAVQAAVAAFVASIGVAIYQRQKASRDARAAYNSQLQDRLQTIQMADAARSRVYGTVRNVEGVLFKGSYGDRKEYFSMLVAVAGHEVDAIEQVYFNDVPVNLLGDIVTDEPWGKWDRRDNQMDVLVTANPMVVTLDRTPLADSVYVGVAKFGSGDISVSGNVVTLVGEEIGTTVKLHYQTWEQVSYARVYTFNGSPGQDLSGILAQRFGSVINSSHRFSGIACVLVDCLYESGVFASGPPAVSARVRGARVHDPRTGAFAWSDNPALCALDWALYPFGGDREESDLVVDSFKTAANVCDQVVTYTRTDGSTQTRKRYTCGYVARTDTNPETHLAELVEAMGGRHAWTGGQLRVRAGGWVAPALTITDDYLSDSGQRRVTDSLSTADLVNVMRVSIADESLNHIVVQLPELRAQTYIDADGEELVSEDTFGAVTNSAQAFYLQAIRMRELRQGMNAQWPVTMRAFGLQVLDRVYVQSKRYGWTQAQPKAFDVLGLSLNVAQNLIMLELKETGASIYDMGTGFPVLDTEANTTLPKVWKVSDVQVLGVATGTAQLLVQGDGSVMSRALVTWQPVPDEGVRNGGMIELQFMPLAGGRPWQTVQVPGDASEAFLPALQDGVTYLLKVRARTRVATGAWSVQRVFTVVGKTEPPPVPDTFSVRAMPDGTRLLEGGYLSANRPADLAGYRLRYRQGAGPYTWAQMRPFQSDDGFFTTLPIETNLLSAGTWSLGLVGVDTSGNESQPLTIVGVLPNPRLGDAFSYYSFESIGFPGVLTDAKRTTVEGAPALMARDQATWGSLPAWGQWTRWNWHPVSSWTYELDAEDFGSVINTLPVVTVAGEGQFTIEEQHSIDGTTWTAWAALADSFQARYVRIRVRVNATGATGPGVTQVTYITGLQVVYTAAVASEVFEDISPAALIGGNRIGVGDIRVPLASSYATVRVESVVIQSASGQWTWRVVDKAVAGPRIQFLNAGVLADPPLVDIVVKGIRS
jgi:Putative phage tail protein